MKIKITNDLFSIAERIKELNKAYEIYFDTDRQKFVLYANKKLQLVIPYDNLDERTIRHAHFTRSENYQEVMDSVDRYNASLEKDIVKKAQDEIENETSRQLRLANI